MKVKINMIGGGFQHDVCSSALNTPKYIEWVKDGSANISIHIDYAIFQPVDKTKKNYGWVAESSSIIPQVVDGVKKNLQTLKENYEMIFTHDRRIVNLDPSFFKFTLPNACPWIQNKKIYEKNKNISFIVSNKTITEGHRYRLQVLEKYKNYVDHFGMGFTKNLNGGDFDTQINTKSEKARKSGLFHVLAWFYWMTLRHQAFAGHKHRPKVPIRPGSNSLLCSCQPTTWAPDHGRSKFCRSMDLGIWLPPCHRLFWPMTWRHGCWGRCRWPSIDTHQ